MSEALTYDLTDDGITCRTLDGFNIKITGTSPRWISVAITGKNAFVPTEKGDFEKSSFREKLVTKARERFGDVNGLAGSIELISFTLAAHRKERKEAAADHDAEHNAPELAGMPYRISSGDFCRLKPIQGSEMPRY